ncbi:MAG TPA: alcohol dehydrogenase catalytic domain-containing protein [Syntrophorhabdaceae bacterium]
MKAVVWNEKLEFPKDFPVPVPREGEALIKVRVAGICNTDLEIFKGYMGFKGIPGHEFTGIVERVAGGPDDLIGRRVVGEINCSCGVCSYCLQGMKSHCPRRTTLGIAERNGAFAEYLTLPAINLLEVPRGLSDEEAVFTEPLAAAVEITDQNHVKPTDRVLVMGDGKLGLLSVFVLSLTQAHVTLVGKHGWKLDIARKAGIEAISVDHLPPDEKYDMVVEATGRAEGIGEALVRVKPRGTIILKSTVAGGNSINLTPIVINEIKVIGSRCGPFGPALRALSQGSVDVKPLISGIYPIEKAREAFEAARTQGALKILLDFREE